MGDCNFGHAKIPLLVESSQGACCDRKSWRHLEMGHLYKSNTPLTVIPGSVPLTMKPMTSAAEPFSGLRTCETDATEWTEDCKVSVCVEAKNLLTQTIAWWDGITEADVEAVVAKSQEEDCCFDFDSAHCCFDPELPGCEEDGEAAAKEVV